SLAVPFYASIECLRWLLDRLFRVFNITYLSLVRQMEFNADLVAVGAAGSDAPVHVLLRLDFAQECQNMAVPGLLLASDYHRFTRDLFYHQERAAEYLRAAANKPDLGKPPTLPAGPDKQSQVFQPGETGTATMWANHPSHFAREQNAKRRYFRSPEDDR